LGIRATTASAGSSSRRRCAHHPGTGSMTRDEGSRDSRSSMSMYFRSITGQL
jgi:hypothetical protein